MWTNWRKANYNYLKEHLGKGDASKTLIDLGAGPQRFKDLTSKFNLISVDFYHQEGIDVVADITKGLPFNNDSADIILLSNVLEHIPNPEQLIKECWRVLRTSGFIVGVVPFLIKVHQEPHDFLRYTPFMLKRLLGEGCEVKSLGNPRDVYLTASSQYFKKVKKAKMAKFIHGLLTRILPETVPDDKFTEGYGFKVYKN